MNLEKLKEKYGNIKWADLSSPYCPKIYTDVCRDFKKYLKKSFNGYEITGFKANHFDTDGYICNPLTNKYVNIIVRDCRVFSMFDGITYRKAKNTKDFKGEHNNLCKIEDLVEQVKNMLK